MTDELQSRPTVGSIVHVPSWPREATRDRPAITDGEQPAETVEAALRRDVQNLRRALETRDLIWEAKLILAVTMQCSADEAHELVVRQSQHENRKVREIAAEIIEMDRRRRAANDALRSTRSA